VTATAWINIATTKPGQVRRTLRSAQN